MKSYFSQSSQSHIKQVLAISLFIMLLTPGLILLLTSQSEIVSASPDLNTYDFNDAAYAEGWETANASSTLQTPSTVEGWSPASQAKKDDIKTSNDDWWESPGNPEAYVFQYYRFTITEDLENLDNLYLEWEGHHYHADGSNLCYFFIWKEETSAWEQLDSGGQTSDDTLFGTKTNYYSYFRDNGSENQIWLAVRSQEPESGSCPVFYAWNGDTWEFVAEASPSGGLAFPSMTGEEGRQPSHPIDYIPFSGEQVKIENDMIYLLLREDQADISYIDEVKLYGIIHPPNAEVYSATTVQVANPPPSGTIHTVRDPQSVKVWKIENGEKIEITHLTNKNDEVWYKSLLTPILPRSNFQDIWSFTPEYSPENYSQLILDLGDLRDTPQIKLLVKARTLWSYEINKYPFAEVWENDEWVRIETRIDSWAEAPWMNYQTYCIDITDWFNENTENYLIRVNDWRIKAYDYIAVDTSKDDFELVEIPLESVGELIETDWRANRTDFGTFDFYDRNEVSLADTYFVGPFTRLGSGVKPLIEAQDDIFLVMGIGDQVELKFEGMEFDDYVLYVDAFYKEGWVRFLQGDDVTKSEPYPFHEMSYYPYPENESFPWDNEHLEWMDEYQTRYIEVENPKRSSEGSLYGDYVKADVYYTTEDRFGYYNEGVSFDATLNKIKGSYFTASETGTIENIWIYARQDDAGWSKCAIYEKSDNSLVGYTENRNNLIDEPDWYKYSIISEGTVTQGTDYYLVLWSSTGAVMVYYDWKSGGGAYDSETWGDFPDPWVPVSENRIYSIYAEYALNQSPTIENMENTNITASSAGLSVDVYDPNGDNLDWCAFIDNDTNNVIENITTDYSSPHSYSTTWSGLSSNTTYYWKVQASDNQGAISTSSVENFTTSSSPTSENFENINITFQSADLLVDVYDLDGDNIDWCAFIDHDTGNVIENITTTYSSPHSYSKTWEGLSQESLYRWKVQASDNEGNVSTSSIQSFTTELFLFEPTKYFTFGENTTVIETENATDIGKENATLNSIIGDTDIAFEWKAQSVDNHRLLIDNDNDFSSPIENVLLGATDNNWTENEFSLGTYYWKVIAITGAEENSSEMRTFNIAVYENVGYNQGENYSQSIKDRIVGSTFTSGVTGYATSIVAQISSSGGRNPFKYALYDNDFNLLAVTDEENAPTSWTWVELPLQTNPLIEADENYWLVGWGVWVTTDPTMKYESGETDQGINIVKVYASFPDPLTDIFYQDREYSIYMKVIENIQAQFQFKSDRICYNEGENENWSLDDWYYTGIPTDPATVNDWANREPIITIASYDSTDNAKAEADYIWDNENSYYPWVGEDLLQWAINTLSGWDKGDYDNIMGRWENGGYFGENEGGQIFLYDGTYPFQWTIRIRENISIIGESTANTILKYVHPEIGTFISVFRIIAKNLLFENFTIESEGRLSGHELSVMHFWLSYYDPGEAENIFAAYSTFSNIVLRNLKVGKADAIGIYLEPTSRAGWVQINENIWMENVYVYNTGETGLVLATHFNVENLLNRNIYIYDSTFTLCGIISPSYGPSEGVEFWAGSQNIKFVNNIVENNGFGGMMIYGGPTSALENTFNILIQGNKFSRNGISRSDGNSGAERPAIYIRGGDGKTVDNIIIRGNDIDQLYGVYFWDDNAENCIFDNNSFYNTMVDFKNILGTGHIIENNVSPFYTENYYTSLENLTGDIGSYSKHVDNLYMGDYYGERAVGFRAMIVDSYENISDWNVFTSLSAAKAELLSPENESTFKDNTPTFEWFSYGAPVRSEIKVDNDSDFLSLEIFENIEWDGGLQSFTSGVGLSLDNYYWRIVSVYGDGTEENSDVFTFELVLNILPSIENIYITDMDNVPTDNLDPQTQYKFWVEVQDNDGLSDIDNIVLKLYLDNEDLADNARNHYTFSFTNATGAWTSSPAGFIVTENCIAGDNLENVDNYVFAIKLGASAYPTSSDNWDIWSQVFDNFPAQDNENFDNQFDISIYYSISFSSGIITFRGYPGDVDLAAQENPIVDNIASNVNFDLKVSINAGGFGLGENLYCDVDGSSPYTITLDNIFQTLYSNQSWTELVQLNEYYFIDIPENAVPTQYSTNFYTQVVPT